MWTKSPTSDYFLTNGQHTITKIKIGDKTTFQLWYFGKQIIGFASVQDAIDEFDSLEAEKRLENIARNGNDGLHYE